MNRYSWHTTTEKDSGGWYKCTAIVVFPDNTLEFNTYPFYKPNLKGGHRHNHVRNARFRGNVCPYCDGIIAKGCGERRYDGVLFCTECAQADYEERCDRAEYLSHIYG